jgi:hypothetical protein
VSEAAKIMDLVGRYAAKIAEARGTVDSDGDEYEAALNEAASIHAKIETCILALQRRAYEEPAGKPELLCLIGSYAFERVRASDGSARAALEYSKIHSEIVERLTKYRLALGLDPFTGRRPT